MSGAGGITAAHAALAAGADGYTLTLFTNGTAISMSLFQTLPFDPLKQFVPVSSFGYFDCVFVTAANSGYHTFGDVLKAAHDKPGTLNLGSIVVGSTQNLTAQLFKSMSGADMVIVPFRTTPEQVIGLLQNDIQMSVDFYAALKPSLQSGQTRAIATSGPRRSPELPDVPTVQELSLIHIWTSCNKRSTKRCRTLRRTRRTCSALACVFRDRGKILAAFACRHIPVTSAGSFCELMPTSA